MIYFSGAYETILQLSDDRLYFCINWENLTIKKVITAALPYTEENFKKIISCIHLVRGRNKGREINENINLYE